MKTEQRFEAKTKQKIYKVQKKKKKKQKKNLDDRRGRTLLHDSFYTNK